MVTDKMFQTRKKSKPTVEAPEKNQVQLRFVQKRIRILTIKEIIEEREHKLIKIPHYSNSSLNAWLSR